jgi:hypothetical protein
MAKLSAPIVVADLPKSDRNFEPLPEGWYTATITQADMKSSPGKERLNIRYDIVGPTHQGRVVFGGLNMTNPNPDSERISREQFGQILMALGMARCEDTDELIGKTLNIKLKIREASGGYDASNDVKAWKAVNGSSLPVGAPAGAKAPAAGAKPPWAKG